MKNIERIQSGLKCDNPTCDWVDDSIKEEDYESYIDSPCPKCGENVLTREDYQNSLFLSSLVDFVNNLSEEEIEALTANVDLEKVSKDLGIDVNEQDTLKVTFNVHNGINIEKIEKHGN